MLRLEQVRAEILERFERVDRRLAQQEQRLERIQQRTADAADRVEALGDELFARMDALVLAGALAGRGANHHDDHDDHDD